MRGTRAFTLLELIITLVIAGILFAIGAFSYEFVQRATDESVAVSALDRTTTAQQLFAFDVGHYTVYASELQAVGSTVLLVEEGAELSPSASETPTVSFAVSSIGDLGLAVRGPDGCLGRFVENLNYGGAIEDFAIEGTCSGLAVLQRSDPTVELRPYQPGGSSFL